MIQHCQSHQASAVCYFYFDFSDPEKQRHESLIRSLIVQLSVQASSFPEVLKTLYPHSRDGGTQPSIDALIRVFERILQAFDQVFIIIDALDECREREELLSLINGIVGWKMRQLHMLATSRKETDINEALEPLITDQISIQSGLVDADIQIHLQERLHNDPKLKRWPAKVQTEIEAALMNGAHGM